MLTQKQETFCLNLFKGMSQREAWIQAGYSSKYSPAVIDVNACRMANTNKIKLRLGELNQKTEDKSVATVLERKQKLTEIIRDDYKSPITAKEKVTATTELNKMEKVYTETPTIFIEKVEINARDKIESAIARLALRAGEKEDNTGSE